MKNNKKTKKNEKQGFTLIEVLTVIVILSIIATICVASIIKYMDNGRQEYNNKLVETFRLTGKTYFSENQKYLPKGDSYASNVTLGTLKTEGFASKEFIDGNGNRCDSAYSYVQAERQLYNNNIKYKSCLYCGDSYLKDEDCKIVTSEKETCELTVTPSNEYAKQYNINLKYIVREIEEKEIKNSSEEEYDDLKELEQTSNQNQTSIINETIYDETSIDLTSNIKHEDNAYKFGQIQKDGKDYNNTNLNISNNNFKIVDGKLLYIKDSTEICSTDIKIDEKEPSCENVLKQTDANGETYQSESWTNKDVYTKTTCTDNESGCDHVQVSYSNISDNNSYSTSNDLTIKDPGITYVNWKVFDKSGNSKICKSTVKIDKTAPTCEVTMNGAVATATCKDDAEGSGCKEQTLTKTFESTSPETYTFTVKDNAGNTGTCKANYTPPAPTDPARCNAVIMKKETENGSDYTSGSWYNGNVYTTATCLGNNCSSKKTLTTTGATTNVSGEENTSWTVKATGTSKLTWSVYDTDGNEIKCNPVTINVDKNAPECTNVLTDADGKTYTSGSWSASTSLTSNPTCSDSESGCSTTRKVTVTGDSSNYTDYATSKHTITKEGISYIKWKIYDKAGNETICSTSTLKIDRTNPTCTKSLKKSDNKTSYTSGTWYDGSIHNHVSCNDNGGSGCSTQKITVTQGENSSATERTNYETSEKDYTVSAEGTTYTTWKVYDKAGNIGTCSKSTLKIDKTIPNCNFIKKLGCCKSGTSKPNVVYKYTFTDPLSGVDTYKWGHCYKNESHVTKEHTCAYKSIESRQKENSTHSGGGKATASLNLNYKYEHGTVYIYFKVTDKAGNSGTCKYKTSPYNHTFSHTWKESDRKNCTVGSSSCTKFY